MTSTMNRSRLTHLEQLEAESIYILRETASQFERPALLFSGGKDSITLVHLALKAFRPGKFPFPLVHIDTGHNFQEALDFRDELASKIGEKLIIRYVQDSIDQGKAVEEKGKFPSRNGIQTVTLLDTIAEFKFDACIGGARRDEEKARAKERVFQFVMSLVSGIQNYKDPNFGIFITVELVQGKMFVFFQFPTGPNWTFGNISVKKTLHFLLYIFLINDK